jgi:hypothetical protein
MQAARKTIAGMVAFLLLIASLGGLWRVLVANTELRLTGETLSNYLRNHPPKPWRGFEIAILNVSVKGEMHIKAHLSGNLIHTPVEISGIPEYDANARAIFLRVSRTELPRDAARPMLSRFNAMLNPLATYIARNPADIIPAQRIKVETPGGAIFLATVRSVRVEGDVVVVALHGYRVAFATVILMLCTLLSAWLFSIWLRRRLGVKR